MDIERLTKTQIVLLTLLVSFVTSIATGIVTVTLLDQAPPAITQTINRVVERTVERVVPGDTQGASVITQEVTVVVKEEDLITEAIVNNSQSIVRISTLGTEEEEGTFKGFGFLVSQGGLIATNKNVVQEGGSYIATLSSGERFPLPVTSFEEGQSTVFAQVEIPEGEEKRFSPVLFSDLGSLKLGQTVISLSGENRNDVELGIVSSLLQKEIVVSNPDGEEETIEVLSAIETNINSKDILSGSPLINVSGEVIGMHTGALVGPALYTPIGTVEQDLVSLLESQEVIEDKKENNT